MRTIITFLFCVVFHVAHSQSFDEYWSGDTLKLKGNLVDGEREGYWQEWYSNGNIKLEGYYRSGAVDSLWKFYCKHGYSEKDVLWKNGKCFKVINYWLSNQPYLHLNFKNGLSTNEYLEYLKIFQWGRGNQMRIKGDMEEEDSLIHYRFVPLIFVDNELIEDVWSNSKYMIQQDSIFQIEEMRNEYLVRFCKSLNADFEYIEHRDSIKPTRIVKRFEDHVIMESRIEYYTVEPYGVYKENFTLNDKLIHESLYQDPHNRKQTCSEYNKAGNLDSKEMYFKGLPFSKWSFYSNNGELLRKEVYKDGKLIKTKEF